MSSFILTSMRKPEIALIFAFCGGAMGLASAHLYKLSTDPHTMFSKDIEQRRWDEKMPHKYMRVTWSEVMGKKE
jgi:hypothetical protein